MLHWCFSGWLSHRWPPNGHNGAGRAATVTLSVQLPAIFPAAAPTPKWSVDVGLGYSGPVVVAGKLFIHVRDDEKKAERCLCLDALTGKQFWEVSYSCAFQPPDPTAGKGPNATPTVDRERVFSSASAGC